jgi:hypothetical protein
MNSRRDGKLPETVSSHLELVGLYRKQREGSVGKYSSCRVSQLKP